MTHKLLIALLAAASLGTAGAVAHPDHDLDGRHPPSAAAKAPAAPAPATPAAGATRTDETAVTLQPGEGAEVKMTMKAGEVASFSWTAEGGVVNFDTHGEAHSAPDKAHSYNKGRGASSDQGEIKAAFDGKHGWFWRNRGKEPVTIKLRASGSYSDFKRVM